MTFDLTPVPLEAARARSEEPLMGFITPIPSAFGGATGQANENPIRHPRGVLGEDGF